VLDREGNALQLQHLVDNVYYLPGPSNIGLIVGQRQQALLIDTGVGQRSGRQLLRIIQEQGLHLAAILNTHCHGDHIGGNAYLVERTGAQVYAPLHDAVVLQYPIWGTMCMFGGAEPIVEMAAPRFNPQPCAVNVTVTEGSIEIAGIVVQVVPLPGHTGSHTGYIVNDVFFTGDILAGEQELANTALSYAYSITKRLHSLERLRSYSCKYYVLGHGRPESDINDLVERNIAQINDTLDFVRVYLDQGCAEASELLAAMCAHYEIEIRNLRQYFLYYPTLHSLLSHLVSRGEVDYQIHDCRLLWCKAERS
jgi:glyoxylase-like metal-dependent hydrolase (beta-lactamase superfamily II)